MISPMPPTWKTLAQRNLAFRNVLHQLLQHGMIDKSTLKDTLCTECKFELIKMESIGVIEFKEGQLHLLQSMDFDVQSLNNLRKVV